ncbi:MAG: ATP-binding cassette domain-containing protein [Thermoproteota archaeon]|nr:ATP-binding cassette domain-containing protein [Thermoproteota archaeon]
MLEANFTKRLGNFLLKAKFEGDDIICITGRNGAGKTTLLRCLAGIYNIDSGYIKLNGINIESLPIEKRRIVLIDNNSYIPNLSVDEHILWASKNLEKGKLKEIKSLLGINFYGKVGKLSLGQKIRVALATALLSNSKAILVDEAFSHISQKEEFIENFLKLAKEFKIKIVFTTQDINDAKFASYHYLIENGEMKRI